MTTHTPDDAPEPVDGAGGDASPVAASAAPARDAPRPSGPWALAMRWSRLLFLHWPVEPERIAPTLPAPLEPDLHDGRAWLGVVPFEMRGVRPRWVPALPGLSRFPELNLRTYVRGPAGPGVWFYSLDAGHPLAVRLARAGFRLPYFDAAMALEPAGEETRYRSERTHRGAPPGAFDASYRPTGPRIEPDPLERFLTARWRLYSVDLDPQRTPRRVWAGEIDHSPWPLQRAEVEVRRNTLGAMIGLEFAAAGEAPLAHYSHDLEVRAWLPRRVA